jgi:hypothetical protein
VNLEDERSSRNTNKNKSDILKFREKARNGRTAFEPDFLAKVDVMHE